MLLRGDDRCDGNGWLVEPDVRGFDGRLDSYRWESNGQRNHPRKLDERNRWMCRTGHASADVPGIGRGRWNVRVIVGSADGFEERRSKSMLLKRSIERIDDAAGRGRSELAEDKSNGFGERRICDSTLGGCCGVSIFGWRVRNELFSGLDNDSSRASVFSDMCGSKNYERTKIGRRILDGKRNLTWLSSCASFESSVSKSTLGNWAWTSAKICWICADVFTGADGSLSPFTGGMMIEMENGSTTVRCTLYWSSSALSAERRRRRH